MDDSEKAILSYTLKLVESAEKLLIEMKKPEYKKCKQDLGYILPFCTSEQFSWFYEGYRSNGEKEGWNRIESIFSERSIISVMTEQFFASELMEKRKQIVQRGLEAHLTKDYIASISILLPQAEGIVWDLGVAMKMVSPEPNSIKKINSNKEWGFQELIYEIWKDPHLKEFHDKIKDEYYSKEFRHTVLHGRDISQYNRKRSTELILLIWGISAKVNEFFNVGYIYEIIDVRQGNIS